jgi:hypothetical protein
MQQRWIRFVLGIALGLLSFAGNSQQPAPSSAPPPTPAKTEIAPGTLIQVEITSDVDVKKVHAGDTFRTRLWEDVRSGDKVVLPQKTIIVGHVVEAQPRTKDNPESRLTVAFDKALLKDGSELPFHGVVVRVELSSMALAAAEDPHAQPYNQGMNAGSTTNIAMPSQTGPGDQKSPTPGPTYVRDPAIVSQGNPAGTLTVLTSSTKADVKLKRYATLDVQVTRTGE